MSTEKEKAYEYKPIEEFEHYIVTPGGVFGVNRDSVFDNWNQQKIKFSVKITVDGKTVDAEYNPKTFFNIIGPEDNAYWSVMEGEKEKFFSQKDGAILEITSLPDEPAQPSKQFFGPVGDKWTVAYKEGEYSDWKNISNGKGYILNHQDSTFAYPLGDGRGLLYMPPVDTLYVVYTMPNGLPAADNGLSLNQEMKIF